MIVATMVRSERVAVSPAMVAALLGLMACGEGGGAARPADDGGAANSDGVPDASRPADDAGELDARSAEVAADASHATDANFVRDAEAGAPIATGPDGSAVDAGSDPATKWIQVSVGDSDVCAVADDGHAECWGPTTKLRTQLPTFYRFRSVAVGSGFACGIRADGGRIVCWGDGDAPTNQSVSALAPATDVAADLSCGFAGCCYVSSTRDAKCFGTLGGANRFQGTVGPGVRVDNGYYGGCLLLETGTLRCWGDRLRSSPLTVTDFVVAEEAVWSLAEATRDIWRTAISCTESCTETMLLTGLCGGCSVKVLVGPFKAVAGSTCGACAIRDDGAIACAPSPMFVADDCFSAPPAGAFTSISMGNYSCAVRTNGALVCWGGGAPVL